MKSFGKFVSKNRIIILIISMLLLIPSIFGMVKTRVNYDLLTYLPQELDSMKGQVILDTTFHNAATGFLIIEDMPSKNVVALKGKLEKINGVEKVIGINDLVDTSIPENILPDKLKDTFYSKDSTMLMIKFKNNAASIDTQNAIEDIRKVSSKDCFLAGISAIVKDTKDLSDRETPFYVLLAVFLAIIVLLLSMESTLVPFIFMIGIGIGIIYNLGTNIVFGEISYVTKALAAVLQLGVTMDYSIFLLHRYDEEKLKNDNRESAMAEAIAATITSITGSSLTTIAGFLALCAMKLTLGTDIGLVLAKGVLIGVISSVTILPSLILFFDKPIHKYTHKTILPDFKKTAKLVTNKYKVFIVIFLVLFIPGIYGQNHGKVYYNLDDSLPKNLPSIIATDKLKSGYNMITTHFILVKKSIPSYKIKEMVGKIEGLDGIENVIAYDSIVGPNLPDTFLPPEITENFKKGSYNLILANSKYKAARAEENLQIDKLNAIVKSYDNEGMLSGEGPLTKDLIKIAEQDFKNVNLVSIFAIFLIILLVFQSFLIPVILVLSIELAIFINMGIPYYTGTSIPFIASIVIGTIQLGATVDYAILLTSRFREEMRNGLNKFDAMETAVSGSAKSIVTSALTFFAATFGVGLISKMEVVKSLCSLMSRGAIISMLVIIFILPSILLVCEGLISKTSRNWTNAPKLSNLKKIIKSEI